MQPPSLEVRLSTPTPQISLRTHAIVGLTALVLILASVGVWLKLTANRVQAADYEGKATVILPWGWSETARLEAVLLAGGVPVRTGVVKGSVEFLSDSPETMKRLNDMGAWAIVGPLPTHMLALGGCSYLNFTAYDRDGLAAKLQAGPL